MDNTTSTGLGFRLELRGDVWVVQYDTRGCHPASPDEVKLWLALEAAEAELTRRDTVIAGLLDPAGHVEEIAYADDIAEGGEELPEDYERHYCDMDGEDWPCAFTRAIALAAAPVSLEATHANLVPTHLGVFPVQVVPAVSLEAVKAETTTEWEYGVKDYRAPGYMIIGDDPLPAEDRVGYYGTRPLIRRRKAGTWEDVAPEPEETQP